MKSTGKKNLANLPPQSSKFSKGGGFGVIKGPNTPSQFSKQSLTSRPTQFITQHKGGN